MVIHERPISGSGVIIPSNFHKIIDEALIPAGFSGDNTEKYLVRDYPDIVVRHNNGGSSIQEIQETAVAFNELSLFGMDALPYIPVEHRGEAYVITLRVDGRGLDELIEDSPDETLIQSIDDQWSRLALYLSYCLQHHEPVVRDIYTTNQYMYGTITGDEKPRLWLVDLSEWSTKLYMKPWANDYLDMVDDLADTVSDIEYKSHQTLEKSRAAIAYAYELSEHRISSDDMKKALGIY